MPDARRFARPLLAVLLILSAAAAERAEATEASAASAQGCARSDLAGNWVMLNNTTAVIAPYCLLTIARNGTVGTGSCDNAKLTGKIGIAKDCAITAKLTVKADGKVVALKTIAGYLSPDRSYFTMVTTADGGDAAFWSFVQRGAD